MRLKPTARAGAIVRAGSFGLAGCFSFYPGKNLGAAGDAGAIVTDDDALADRDFACLRDHGRSGSHHAHIEIGTNSRLDALQAVVLTAKLRRLDDWNASRRQPDGSLPREPRRLRSSSPAGGRHRSRLHTTWRWCACQRRAEVQALTRPSAASQREFTTRRPVIAVRPTPPTSTVRFRWPRPQQTRFCRSRSHRICPSPKSIGSARQCWKCCHGLDTER